MNDKVKVIPKGAIFTITTGEYSDYETWAVCRALKEIDVDAIQEEYLAEHPGERKEYRFKEERAISWLINEKNYAEEMNFFELHLGDYSTADFCLYSKEERE